MSYISVRIDGVPYGKSKMRGKVDAPAQWTKKVIEQTKDLPKVQNACLFRITFLLPLDKFPPDFPYGPDLDNLLERFLDALNQTVFSEAPGKDSCVVSLQVMKTKVDDKSWSTYRDITCETHLTTHLCARSCYRAAFTTVAC